MISSDSSGSLERRPMKPWRSSSRRKCIGRRSWEGLRSREVRRREAQYLQTTPAHLLEVAGRLVAAQGLLRIEREWAEATPGLMNQAERFESARRSAVEELEKKHAFERG